MTPVPSPTRAPGRRALALATSLCWYGDEVIVAVEVKSRTARNASA